MVLKCTVLSSFRAQSPLLKKSRIELLFCFQRQAKYTENKLKAIKARNEYLLALEATNASVFKYYIHDLSDLIDVSASSWGLRGAFFLGLENWSGVAQFCSSVARPLGAF